MANILYPKAKEGFLGGDIALDTGNIKAVLCRDAYVDSHEFLSSISNIVATSGNLTSKTIDLGVFNTDDIVYPTVPTTAATPNVILYQDSGNTATSRLIAFIDTATGLPVTPNGTNITVEVNVAGWFTL